MRENETRKKGNLIPVFHKYQTKRQTVGTNAHERMGRNINGICTAS